MSKLQECDFVVAAKMLNCEVAAIKAVAEVESAGGGFLSNGRPKILFERHYFHRLTGGEYSAAHPDISNRNAGGYTSNEHARLEKAAKLDRNAALQSASWGKFQIMGAHWKALGYSSIQEFINAMYASETEHLMAFVKFVKVNGLSYELQRKDWAGFARGYNGSNYHINKYDQKMAVAYNKYKNKLQ